MNSIQTTDTLHPVRQAALSELRPADTNSVICVHIKCVQLSKPGEVSEKIMNLTFQVSEL